MCRSRFGAELGFTSVDVDIGWLCGGGGDGDFHGRTGLEFRRRRFMFSFRWSRGEFECANLLRDKLACGECCAMWDSFGGKQMSGEHMVAITFIFDAIISGDGVVECDFFM